MFSDWRVARPRPLPLASVRFPGDGDGDEGVCVSEGLVWGLVGDESCDVETTGDWSASELDTPPRLARGQRSRQHMQHVCAHRGYRNHALSIASQSNMASEYTKLIYSSMYTNTHTHAHTYSAELLLTCDDPSQNFLFRRSQRLPGLGPSSACAHLSFLAYI